MKKLIPLLLLLLTITGCMAEEHASEGQSGERQPPIEIDENVKELILSIVENFGYQLQNVSLLGPKEELEKSMRKHYSGLVSSELIGQWLNDPVNAPGRLTSSPWPDRIDVTDIQKVSESKYSINGEIVEITSVPEIAAKIPIHLLVEKVGERWMITDVRIDKDENYDQIFYENDKYGFLFKLPAGWKDYSIVEDEWKGVSTNGEVIETGPIISIRHPEWTPENPRQDIPIMILNLEQWELMQSDEFHIGAAPIRPRELARNVQYVFALPARYNFAFPTGYEEVEKIIESNPIEVQL
ncbi:hypothetical protein ACFOZY_06580 [Chungangia koreensis]|uniref:DUF3828 domain-containing protein n=1 Tax=Chungangia koreensis TaxID=752657 RepID=A0ABV8X484_9LACT